MTPKRSNPITTLCTRTETAKEYGCRFSSGCAEKSEIVGEDLLMTG
jgi:hypothetical protein